MTNALTYSTPNIKSLSILLSEHRSSYKKNKKAQFLDVGETITSASPEVQQIIERVLQVEKDRLYTKKSRGINDDILKIIQEAIPE